MAQMPWLLFDADDTLWDNNVFFEIAIAEFFEFLRVPEQHLKSARRQLDEIEMRNIEKHGYGTANFGLNLVECFEAAKGRSATAEERLRIERLVDAVREHRIEPYPQVRETLDELGRRSRLALVTKGEATEQKAKIERSGLAGHFEHIEYLPEKDAARYLRLVADLNASPESTWMIGNSPKSDVNPALAAGLGAVLIPNKNTWTLEVQAVPQDHPRFRMVRRFSDLTTIF